MKVCHVRKKKTRKLQMDAERCFSFCTAHTRQLAFPTGHLRSARLVRAHLVLHSTYGPTRTPHAGPATRRGCIRRAKPCRYSSSGGDLVRCDRIAACDNFQLGRGIQERSIAGVYIYCPQSCKRCQTESSTSPARSARALPVRRQQRSWPCEPARVGAPWHSKRIARAR
jgi:hypothetical protein